MYKFAGLLSIGPSQKAQCQKAQIKKPSVKRPNTDLKRPSKKGPVSKGPNENQKGPHPKAQCQKAQVMKKAHIQWPSAKRPIFIGPTFEGPCSSFGGLITSTYKLDHGMYTAGYFLNWLS